MSCATVTFIGSFGVVYINLSTWGRITYVGTSAVTWGLVILCGVFTIIAHVGTRVRQSMQQKTCSTTFYEGGVSCGVNFFGLFGNGMGGVATFVCIDYV